MCSSRSVSDSISADKSSIGFDYQYYFFLWKVLCLQPNQSAGLECKDDVHTELDNDIQILYQLKHTVKKSKTTGNPINLASLDLDLWKTIFNWSKLIKDPKGGRGKPHEQIKFLQKTIFVLASNKSETKNNSVSLLIENINNGDIDCSNIVDEIKLLASKSKSGDIQKYSNEIVLLSSDVLCKFFKNIKFELGEDYIISRCHDAIKAKMIDENNVDIVFKLIDSSIKEHNFINVKENNKILISFDEFHRRYRKYFQNYQNTKLNVYDFDEKLPNGIEDLTFIKQLVEIDDFDINDTDTMIEYVSLMIKFKSNVNNWYLNGDITDLELKSLKTNSVLDWKNKWKAKYRRFDESFHNQNALELVDDMRMNKIVSDIFPNDLSISNGYLYCLSEAPDIGWRKDWEKYKK